MIKECTVRKRVKPSSNFERVEKDHLPIFHVGSSTGITPVTNVKMYVIGTKLSSFHDSGARRLLLGSVGDGRPQGVSHASCIRRKRSRDLSKQISHFRLHRRRRSSEDRFSFPRCECPTLTVLQESGNSKTSLGSDTVHLHTMLTITFTRI